MTDSMEEFFGKPIDTYTRAQALADGVLVDVTAQAKETGFTIPVAVTEALWALIEWPEEQGSTQSTRGRLHDVLFMLYLAVKDRADKDSPEIHFRLHLPQAHSPDNKPITLKAIISSGDYGEPVMTIMLPDED